MKKLFVSMIAVAIAITAFAQSKPKTVDPRFAGLDAELTKVLNTWNAAGFAVAVVEKNKIVYSKGFGYRDYEKKLPVTPNTLFAIGSCSKSFTSAVLGLLRKDSKVSFEDAPAKYLPKLRFFNSEMNNNIIVRDLMSHRTGLPRHDYSWYLFPTFDRDSLIARIKYQEPFTGVRKQWYYNNFGFLLQGAIAEHVTGKSWEDNIREKFFGPLGMATSNVSITELEKSVEPALGYETKKGKVVRSDYYHIAAMAPAGSINSSVNEMSNWVITWINGGSFNDKEVLPAVYVNEAISSHMIINSSLPSKEHPDVFFSNYGYGWFLASYKGHYRVEHGGNIDGFSASTCFFPTDSIGIVVLANQNGSTIPSIARNIVADRMLKLARTDWNKEIKDRRDKDENAAALAEKEKTKNKIAATKPSHALKEYTGRFGNPGYGSFDVVLQHDSLFARFHKSKFWLRHLHYDVFESLPADKNKIDTAEVWDIKTSFISNETGEIQSVSMKIEATLDPIIFKREVVAATMEKSAMENYVGEYELSGVTARFFIRNGNTLALIVPGQPEYTLVPTEKNKFVLKGIEGYKVEFVEAEGKIKEAVFVQPNGIFRAKRK